MDHEVQFEDNAAGIVEAKSFYAAAGHADVRDKKDGRLDTGLIYSEKPCAAAGVFTKNAVKAAPVLDCERVLASGKPIHGIVANSGNANACTGTQGIADSLEMLRTAEASCAVPEGGFLVCSTGRIGDLLPMSRLNSTIAELGPIVRGGSKAGSDFAQCILTSDTRNKACVARFSVEGKEVVVSGVAKGSGMIQPDMATMLAFVSTDIEATSDALKAALVKAVDHTFNAITVDGDMSTNDTVLLLANGESGVGLNESTQALFERALYLVCDNLADKIVADGERITKVVELLISGAASDSDAQNIARAIGNSLLVKSSWYGNDPNWGRLMDALGYADAQIDQYAVDISYGNVPALVSGDPIPENKPRWKEVVSNPRFSIKINMGQGEGSYRLRATDLTEGYVDFNKSE